MKKISLSCLTLILAGILSGCSPISADRYSSKSLELMIARNGQPTRTYDVDQVRRAFVWEKTYIQEVETSPLMVRQLSGGPLFVDSLKSNRRVKCEYVLFAIQTQSNEKSSKAWQVVGSIKPGFECAGQFS